MTEDIKFYLTLFGGVAFVIGYIICWMWIIKLFLWLF